MVKVEPAPPTLGEQRTRSARIEPRRQAQAGKADTQGARLNALDHTQTHRSRAIERGAGGREQQQLVGDEELAGDRQGIFQPLVVDRDLAPAPAVAAAPIPAATAAGSPSVITTAIVAIIRMRTGARHERVQHRQLGKGSDMQRQQQGHGAQGSAQSGRGRAKQGHLHSAPDEPGQRARGMAERGHGVSVCMRRRFHHGDNIAIAMPFA